MRLKVLRLIQRIYNGVINHASSYWYRQFLGYVGKDTIIRNHCRLEGDMLERVEIGDACDIDSFSVIGCRKRLFVEGKYVVPELKIGHRCIFGQYNHITAVNRIVIGNNLLTGRFVLITDNSHGGLDKEELERHPSIRDLESKGEVVIGDNVWIGDKVSVLPGVHIGDGSIIGANSVVTHDIPPYCIVAGCPATILKRLYI